ncbi:hypothetical protein HDV00_005507 [Rhizophlyctis rosea]|nr:hypothetical protein HDV00_005507 [Rhizophlyctis rosea]
MPRTSLPSILTPKSLPSTLSTTVPIDPSILTDIEHHATTLAQNVSSLLSSLQTRMSQITSSTSQSVQTHHNATTNLCTEASLATEKMVALIRAVDELTHDLGDVESLAHQIKTLKDSLDWLEAVIDS